MELAATARLFQACQVATESLSDQVLEAVVASTKAPSWAAKLHAGHFLFLDLAQVFFDVGYAVRPECGCAIYIAQSLRFGRLWSAQNHGAIEFFGPDPEPVAAAFRAPAEFFPLRRFHDGPAHGRVVVRARPRWASVAAAAVGEPGIRHGTDYTVQRAC